MSWQNRERAALKREATAKLAGVASTLRATSTWDPPATAATQGAETATTISVPGAAVGDCVLVGHTGVLGTTAVEIEAQVSAADTVRARIINTTAAAVDVPSGTLKVVVFK